ncbi:MAG: 16S rRNA (guanine(527)-N(7))-methyltransferase RsmG [Candidatus Acidiferrum sp.]
MATGSHKAPSSETIRQQLKAFSIEVNDEQVVCIQQYIEILLHWNEKLNLTAIRDPLEILVRHFCESMFGATAVPINSGRLADIGSGAGFPGIPMKILRPEIELFLVESNIKKGTFLAEVIRETGLKNSRVLISRYEELGEELAPLDVVCSRALGDFEPFLAWAASDKVSAGKAVLWIGGRDLDEVKKSELWDWQEPIAVPQSLRRYLLVGAKRPKEVGATTTK